MRNGLPPSLQISLDRDAFANALFTGVGLAGMTDTLRESVQRALGSSHQIDRELGGGGMSRVFIAHDQSLDRDVVVKVLSGDATAGLSGDRFRREIQVIARLQHPHIVSILSAGAADGALFYMMPYVRGETLRALMGRSGGMPVADVVRIVREILDALAFAHDNSVVHRDIKPENVLLEAGHALLADFGIAKALQESGNMTSIGMALGTPAYMAPEQATGDPNTDHRADIYAVGVVAYEMLTGAPLFSGSTQQVVAAHITTPAPVVTALRPEVPVPLAHVIARALEKEPSARPQNARAMIAALDAISTPSGLRATSAPARSSRRWLLVGAGVAVAVVAGLAFMRNTRAANNAGPVSAGAELIAVMPLSAVSDTSLSRFGQDLAVTLSANFDGVGSVRTIDAMTLLMKARRLPSPLSLDDAQQLAREIGAGSVLTGTLIGVGDQTRASVVLYRVGSDSVLAKASATAAPKDISALTDSLTWAVLQQVWRRGTPPSPVLAGLTTASFDALRAFLDGERKFLSLDRGALADYRRAFELDTNFAQAYLRFDYVNGWFLNAPDERVYERLLALKGQLPEREQRWVETREKSLPLPERVAEWKALAARYPDYPPFLMAAADPIVHWGPLYGIPMSDAQPLLDRLDQLVPDHADTRFHRAVALEFTSTQADAGNAMIEAGRMTSGAFGEFVRMDGMIRRAVATGTPLPPRDSAVALAQALARSISEFPMLAMITGILSFTPDSIAYQLRQVDAVRRAGVYSGDAERSVAFGESILQAERGNWSAGLATARKMEQSGLPVSMRMNAARLAGLGAWLEAVDSGVADTTIRRAMRLLIDVAGRSDRIELHFLDGLIGVVVGDATRWREAQRVLAADTSLIARHTLRSLAGLWLNRTDPAAAADTLTAVSDDVMRKGGYLVSVESLNRLLIARALRRQDRPGDAERYLMWTDAAMNFPATVSAKGMLTPVTWNERALSFDAAGNRDAAIKYYRQFVDTYDQPPPAHRATVDNARERLATLEQSDRPKSTPVPKANKPGSPP